MIEKLLESLVKVIEENNSLLRKTLADKPEAKADAPAVEEPKTDKPKTDKPKTDKPKADKPETVKTETVKSKVTEPTGPTIDEVRSALTAHAAEFGRASALAILKTFGADHTNTLSPSNYAAVLDALAPAKTAQVEEEF